MKHTKEKKPKKRKGEIRQDYYGTWFIILKEGHDERWVGSILEHDFEKLMSGKKIYSEKTKGLLYKRGIKIWLERDIDKEFNNNQIWTLVINPFFMRNP